MMIRRRDVLADVGVHSYQVGQLDGSDLDTVTWRCTCCRMGEDNGSDANAAPAGEEEEEDAWSVFDPHDSSSHVGQPVKKGRRRTRPLRRRDSRECFDGLVVFSQTVKTTKFAS